MKVFRLIFFLPLNNSPFFRQFIHVTQHFYLSPIVKRGKKSKIQT